MGRKRILGKTVDFLTGREIPDTDDERLLQNFSVFLVEQKGYTKSEILRRSRIAIDLDGRRLFSIIDFLVHRGKLPFMAVKYGPGSLVTRERPALAAARLAEGGPFPITVITNGIDAEILSTKSGEVIGTGLDAIPSRTGSFPHPDVPPLSLEKKEAEMRIISAYDYLEHSLECDDDWCDP